MFDYKIKNPLCLFKPLEALALIPLLPVNPQLLLPPQG